MAFAFGETPFNVTDMVAASFTSPGSYGSDVRFEAGTEMSADPQSDAIELEGYGKFIEIATILTHINLSVAFGGADVAIMDLLNGVTEATTGTTPTSIGKTDIDTGGSGLPYIGIIGDLAATGIANYSVGVPKLKMDTVTALTLMQRAFLVQSGSARGISDGTRAIRFTRRETSATSAHATYYA